MIKAILSDFDGTLVDKNLKYDPHVTAMETLNIFRK